ncbi:MAG: DegT/DnrJ/EryC1/StrS family aminotransferase [Moraxellaceae bacterium]|nr:DegT/DnrJ/EryC1/StrS family aminotransferase [Moraxellaceae bacterium]
MSSSSDTLVAGSIPRLPTFGWHALRHSRRLPLPTVLDLPHRTLTTSGRAAIVLALRVLQVGPGDKVLVPTYHCPTMIAPVTACGATPVFFPITASGDADIAWLERQDTHGVKAIIAVHYFGLPLHFAPLRAFCDARGIAMIEDCAHALFGECDGRPIGAWGDVAIASLTKFLPVQECGVLASRMHPVPALAGASRSLTHEVKSGIDVLEMACRHGGLPPFGALLDGLFRLKRRLRRTPLTTATETIEAPPEDTQWLDAALIDTPPTAISRWCIRASLRAAVIERRRANYRRLAALLADLPGAAPLVPELPAGCAPYVFPLLSERADERYRALRASGLPLFRWDWLWPDTPQLPGDHGNLWSRQVFQLPCHQDLRDADLECIAATVRQVCQTWPA